MFQFKQSCAKQSSSMLQNTQSLESSRSGSLKKTLYRKPLWISGGRSISPGVDEEPHHVFLHNRSTKFARELFRYLFLSLIGHRGQLRAPVSSEIFTKLSNEPMYNYISFSYIHARELLQIELLKLDDDLYSTRKRKEDPFYLEVKRTLSNSTSCPEERSLERPLFTSRFNP